MERLETRTDEILSEEQAGFKLLHCTIDHIFTIRQLTEKYTNLTRDLYICYVDFRKAFDSIWREGLWKVMTHLRHPEKIVRTLENLYSGALSAARVRANN